MPAIPRPHVNPSVRIGPPRPIGHDSGQQRLPVRENLTSLRSALKRFSGSVQLAGMALEGCEPRTLLVALAPEPGLPMALDGPFSDAEYLYYDYAVYRTDLRAVVSARLQFAESPCPSGGETYDLILLFLPKSKDLIEHVFSVLGQVLAPGGTLLVVGPKKSSIRSCKELLARHVGPVVGTQAARHAMLLTVRKAVIESERVHGQQTYEIEAWGQRLRVVSLPGVFSHGRLDAGTEYLLAELALPSWSEALDFGCGAGVLGALLRLARPDTRVDLVDSNVLALDAARRTLRANQLEDSGVWPSDALSDVTGTYDLIISNPPFHQGLATDFSATNQLIKEAPSHLKRGGRLVLVANTFIDYISHLRKHFREVSVLAQSPRYRILDAQGPR